MRPLAFSLPLLIRKCLDMAAIGAGEEPRAVGRPDQAAEAGRDRPAPETRAKRWSPREARAVGQEDLGLVQDGEDLFAGMHGQVDRPAGEGDRARPRSAGPRRPGSCRRAGGPSTPGS